MNSTKFCHGLRRLTLLLLSAACLIASPAHADNLTWTGAVNNSWNTTDANWSGDDTVFATGDDVLFNGTSGEITGIVSRSPASTTVTSNNKITFATGIMGATKPIGGPSILTGALIKNGTGELELGDPLLGQQFGDAADRNRYSNSFTSVTVNAGTLRFRSRAALGTGTVTLAGGTKFIPASEAGRFNTNNEHIDNHFVLSGGIVEFPLVFGSNSSDCWLRNGKISGPGGIKVTGSSRTLALQGNNTYEGGTTIDSTGNIGLLIASYTALGTGTFTANQSQMTVTTGAGSGFMAGIDLPGNTTYPNGVTNAFVINPGKFLNVYCTSSSNTLRLGGDISGGGTLNKWRNSSTLILSGNNTYSGGTIIANGKIICESENSLGSGPLTLGTSGRLQLDFVGSSDVASLSLGGTTMANGTWGSSSSPADNKNDTYFSGFGIVTVGPPKAPTTTALAQTAGTNPTNIGFSVTFTATVSGGTPSGSVAFYDGLTLLGISPLDGAFQASVSTTALPEGNRSIVAQYQGDATYASSTSSPFPIQVIDARSASATTLALTSGSNPSPKGASVTFTATVTGLSPVGTVTFYDRKNLLGSVALNGSAQASITTDTLPNGRRRITAMYSGDLNNKPSTNTYIQNVNAPAGNGKLKVFILAGQSNMQGHGRTEFGRNPENLTASLIVGGIGSLRGATTRDPLKYGYLLDPTTTVNGQSGFTTRDDVYVSYWSNTNSSDANSATVRRRRGNLDAQFGVSDSSTDGRIGPEYAFGNVVGAGLGDQVLLIKTAWGGKSLYVDFRPPSSGGTVGPYYLDMVDKVRTVLNDLPNQYPGYDGNGYELVGLGWHQGWNDQGNAAATAEYEANLSNLIKDLRTEFNVPNLKVVIGNTGMSGDQTLLQAQANVALRPEFAGTVTTVDTRPFFYGAFQSPIDQGYHWNGNGETYFQIGESMGEAMLALLPVAPTSAFQTWASGPFTSNLTDPNPALDFDNGGLETALEWVLGGDPTDASDDNALAPTLNTNDPDNLIFTFKRRVLAHTDPNTSITVKYGSNLTGWTSATHGQNGITIDDTAIPLAGFRTVVVSIPKALAVDDKLFARLEASIAP
jgi:alpha-galactosidase